METASILVLGYPRAEKLESEQAQTEAGQIREYQDRQSER